jgi:hypothetical protein
MKSKKPRKPKLSDVIEHLDTGGVPPDPAMSSLMATASPTRAAPEFATTGPVAAVIAPAARIVAAPPKPSCLPPPKSKTQAWSIAVLVLLVTTLVVAGPAAAAMLLLFANPFGLLIVGLAIWKLWDLS